MKKSVASQTSEQLLAEYSAACNYPGRLDVRAVEDALRRWCQTLGANRRRLHCADGPALESDIENMYFWHGVLVPEGVVMRPEQITMQQIRAEDNAEVRRVMIERYGEQRYIVDSGMKATAHDERYGTI